MKTPTVEEAHITYAKALRSLAITTELYAHGRVNKIALAEAEAFTYRAQADLQDALANASHKS